jgi:aspartate/methionine/tyrosine aminotransferase
LPDFFFQQDAQGVDILMSATTLSSWTFQRPASTGLLEPRDSHPVIQRPGSPSRLFAERARRIGTEAAFGLGARVAEVESLGERVIRCNIGQPDYPLPAHIADALKRAVDDGLTTYCAPEGIPELRRAVAVSLSERHGLDIDPGRVVVYPGHRPAIGFAHLAYVEAGEEVVYPSPGYPLYESFIPYYRSVAVPAVLREEDDFGLTRAVLEPLLNERTALIFLNFPSNPTGSVATRAQLEELAEVILERTGPDTRVFSDEAYEAINFDGHEHVSIASIPGMESRTIISSGCSKTFSWTGGRVGWAVYPTAREAQMARRLSINHFASISPYNQWAAVEALTSPLSAPAIQEMVRGFQRRRDLVVAGLNAVEAFRCPTPKGAFYAFPNVGGALENVGAMEAYRRLPEDARRDSSPATLFQLFLLHEYRVATVDRRSFSLMGSEGQHYLRLSTATSDCDLEESVRRMAAAAVDEAGFQRFVASGVKLTL